MNTATKHLAYLFIVTVSLIVFSAFAQQDWVKMMQYRDANFYEIQAEFESYWEDREIGKGKGWKPYTRWAQFMEPRVYPTGDIFAPDQAAKVYSAYKRTHLHGLESDRNDDWQPLGPAEVNVIFVHPGLGRVNGVTAHPTDPDTYYAGAPAGGFWKTTDGAQSWTTSTDELGSIGVTSIAVDPFDPNTIFIATGDGDASVTYSIGVLKSTDGGDTWNSTGLNWSTTQFTTINKLLIHPTHPNIIFAATRAGIYRSLDGGETWSVVLSGSYQDIEFKPGDASIIYVAGTSLYRSTNEGDNWEPLTTGLPSPTAVNRLAIAVTPANPEYIYILASSSTNSGYQGLYRSVDGGSIFSLQSNSPNLLGWSTDGSDSGGQGWYTLTVAVSPLDANEVFVGGVNVWKSLDGGVSWDLNAYYIINTGYGYTHADIHALDFHGNKLLCGSDGGVYTSDDFGETWDDLSTGLQITQLYRIGGYPGDPNLMLAGAQDNGSFRYEGTSTWSHVYAGDGMECFVDYSNPDIMYASWQFGNLAKSINGGDSFFPIDAGLPEADNGAWISPFMIDPVDPETIYAAMTNVWKSINSGATWTSLTNFSGSVMRTMDISRTDPDYIYAGTYYTLHGSQDGGATWTDITAGLPVSSAVMTYLEISEEDPKKLWVTFSGYVGGVKVYMSEDAGASWINYSGSLPNLPANCIVHQANANDAVYIGMDLGIYYRNEFMSDWELYTDGLPNTLVYELEIHEPTNMLRAATFGRGVWESPLEEILAPPDIQVSPADSIMFTVDAGGSDGAEITITNTGEIDLSWTVLETALILNNRPGFGPAEKSTEDTTAQAYGDPAILDLASQDNDRATLHPASKKQIRHTSEASSQRRSDPLSLILDDGSGESAVAVSGGGQWVWLNRFTPDVNEFPITLEEIQMIFHSTVQIGELVDIYIYKDTDGDGDPATNAEHVGSIPDAAVQYNDGLTWSQFPADPAISIEEPGDVIIAVVNRTAGIDDGDSPASIDLHISQFRSYVGIDFGNPVDPPAFPSGALWGRIDDFDIPGNWMIRGYGQNSGGACPWLTVDIATGTTPGPNGESIINLSVDATDLTPGRYNCLLKIFSNDPDTPEWDLAVTLNAQSPVAISTSDDKFPDAYSLFQNYPNPFNPETMISLQLPVRSDISLKIYDVHGRVVHELANGQLVAGIHEFVWTGIADDGEAAPSGVYFYRLRAIEVSRRVHYQEPFVKTRKMLLVR